MYFTKRNNVKLIKLPPHLNKFMFGKINFLEHLQLFFEFYVSNRHFQLKIDNFNQKCILALKIFTKSQGLDLRFGYLSESSQGFDLHFAKSHGEFSKSTSMTYNLNVIRR